ncbi:hypothetical protein P9152_01090 [Bacillus subtilis]|uniref:hypothetical protein n=1 Tax=Bacillus TaxID=1386 RepID=UPI002DB69CE9|nr:hypothetical protein [Bacillus subtilis]MEC3621581.1 hypothetical protein [Bacillus subtilis]MEC3633428.1 hypothetical protein [Bacillus subtilis]MEC3643826.1 hypothetical protein [Bacillus subtilis]MEC3648821.1 hypothetical protein [Bacillus subtilis]MEC3699023.1 hypothetical protein [Bacillus subtilis]
MKKWLLGFSALTLSITLAACGSEDTSNNSSKKETSSENGTSDTSDKTKTDSKYTANDVLAAFKDANLKTPEDRDNTDKQCSSLGCSQLITTEAVSIYQWPSEKKAKEVSKSFDYQKETFTIRFNDKSVEQQPYKDALNDLIK